MKPIKYEIVVNINHIEIEEEVKNTRYAEYAKGVIKLAENSCTTQRTSVLAALKEKKAV